MGVDPLGLAAFTIQTNAVSGSYILARENQRWDFGFTLNINVNGQFDYDASLNVSGNLEIGKWRKFFPASGEASGGAWGSVSMSLDVDYTLNIVGWEEDTNFNVNSAYKSGTRPRDVDDWLEYAGFGDGWTEISQTTNPAVHDSAANSSTYYTYDDFTRYSVVDETWDWTGSVRAEQ
jgi:hypothetical protein